MVGNGEQSARFAVASGVSDHSSMGPRGDCDQSRSRMRWAISLEPVIKFLARDREARLLMRITAAQWVRLSKHSRAEKPMWRWQGGRDSAGAIARVEAAEPGLQRSRAGGQSWRTGLASQPERADPASWPGRLRAFAGSNCGRARDGPASA